MRSGFGRPLWIFLLLTLVSSLHAQEPGTVASWLTTPDRTSLLSRQVAVMRFENEPVLPLVIDVDDSQKYQAMDGFGLALTGGSAQLIMQMDAEHRHELLEELFGTGANDIGVSYMRVSIGSSDMNDHAFTYDDLPPGQTDMALNHFDLGPDRSTVVAALREILEINPAIRIVAAPWSAPAWMKTNDQLKAGSLRPEYYSVYARYFVKYIDSMRAQGIAIDAVTPQNEPLNPNNTPSLVMQAGEEAAFISHSLGPAFRRAGITTKIIVYDHNCDRPDYPLAILADPAARKYVDGSAFHLYGGQITALTQVHDAWPKKNVYFTEQMVVDHPGDPKLEIAGAVADLVIGAPRNWSRNVLLWNLAADPQFGPHTNDGGCPVCEGAVTINGNEVTRNAAWYTIAHTSKFVRPGSVRIASNPVEGLPDVAFSTPDGHKVLIVANTSSSPQRFQIHWHEKSVTTTLDPGAVATYLWE
jgi:glucosylceramidase